jgi:hypothetical protein
MQKIYLNNLKRNKMKQIIGGFAGMFIGLLMCYEVVIIVRKFKKK